MPEVVSSSWTILSRDAACPRGVLLMGVLTCGLRGVRICSPGASSMVRKGDIVGGVGVGIGVVGGDDDNDVVWSSSFLERIDEDVKHLKL